MKKLIFIIGILALSAQSCKKDTTQEIKCIQCQDLIQPDKYVPGYCGTPDMAADYVNYMEAVKISNRKKYSCSEVGK